MVLMLCGIVLLVLSVIAVMLGLIWPAVIGAVVAGLFIANAVTNRRNERSRSSHN